MAHILAAVIGYPIGHSLSPVIHNYWIKHYGLSGAYEAVEVLPDNLENSVRYLAREGYKGFNVTLPYKQKIMDLCSFVDGTGEQIGAVNTVVINKDGTMHGSNTDAFGFIESVAESVPAFSFAGKTALVLGAGGAARAICFALQREGVGSLFVANRTKEKADTLAKTFSGKAIEWKNREKAAGKADIVINTTSLGMAGKEPLSFDFKYVSPETVVCDIVYAPLETELLRKAKECGCKTVSGIGMLLHQARPAFQAWYGILPEVTDELRQLVTGKL